jgi:hypothetical protein
VVAVFYPGTFTPDVIDMCTQAMNDVIIDAHAPVAVGVWGFFDPPVALIFTLVTLTIATASYAILRERLRQWPAALYCSLMLFAPPVLSFLGVQGKDAWFVASSLSVIALLSWAQRVRGPWPTALVGGALMVAAWFALGARKNAAIPLMVVALVGWPPNWLPTYLWGRLKGRPGRVATFAGRLVFPMAAVVLLVLIQGLWSKAVVQPLPTYSEQWTMRVDIAQTSLRSGRNLFPESLRELGVSPTETGPEWTRGLNLQIARDRALRSTEDVSELRSAWLRAIASEPAAYLSFRSRYAAALMGITGTPFAMTETPVTLERMPPEWGEFRCDIPDRAFLAASDLVDRYIRKVQASPAARPWVMLVVLLSAALVAGLRSCAARSLLAFALVNQLTIVLFSVDPIGRYSWPMFVSAALMVGLALWRVPALARE